MKKLFLALALTGMVSAVSASTVSSLNGISVSIVKGDDKKGDDKNKKKEKSCSKDEKSCCKKDAGKKSCCAKGEKKDEKK